MRLLDKLFAGGWGRDGRIAKASGVRRNKRLRSRVERRSPSAGFEPLENRAMLAMVAAADFSTFADGGLVGQGGWQQYNVQDTSPLTVTDGRVTWAGNGTTASNHQDAMLSFGETISQPLVGTTVLHFDMVVSILSAGQSPSYFAALNQLDGTSTSGNFQNVRMVAQSSGAGFVFGTRLNGQGGYPFAYGTTELNFGETYAVRAAVNLVAGNANDFIELFVGSDFDNLNPHATAVYTSGTVNDISAGAMLLSQFSSGTIFESGVSIESMSVTVASEPVVTNTLVFTGVPTTLNEGEFDILATVSIPAPIESNLVVTITSSDDTEIVLDNGDFNQSGTTTVTIFAGQTSAEFYIEALEDGDVDEDVVVTLTASVGDASYDPAITTITVVNIDVTPAPLPAEGYTQDFATFAAATPDLPLGWTGVGLVTTFPGSSNDWGAGTSGGYRGGASVLGYQHTGSTSTTQSPNFDKVLTLQNATESTITELTVAYTGRAERIDDASATRFPAYTVTVAGNTVEALAFSTGDGDGIPRSSSLTGLSIAAGETFQIVWRSDRGSGSGGSRQIGLSDVSVTLGVVQTLPTVSGLSIPTATLGRESAEVVAMVVSDGGDPLSATGFVFIATSALVGNLTLDTVGAVNVPEGFAGVGQISETLSGLTAGTDYTIRGYATNSLGTAYSAAQTFTTVSAPVSFGGLYTQDFAAYQGVLPTGWAAGTTNEANNYIGEWGTGSSAGFLGVGETETAGVLGYQHTTTSGQLVVTLMLVNDTGFEITELDVGYLGRVARDTQTRTPEWTVTVAGNTVAELAYSTGNTAGEGDVAADLPLAFLLSGLSIAPGAEFTITWTSINEAAGGGQSGASRQIGIADVSVALPGDAAPMIETTGTLIAVSTTGGTASSPSTIAVAGSDLSGVITATAPFGFEVASDGVNYGASATFTPVAGAVNGTLSIRLAAATGVGSYSGDVTLESAGADSVTVAMPASTVSNTPIKVTGLFARGSTWNSTYLDLGVFTTVGADKLGYGLKDGASQLATSGVNAAQVTWNNVNRISVQFDQPITAPVASALQLIRGDTDGDVTITPTAVSLLAGGTVAQFSLPTSLVTGQYIISIGAGGIFDVAGTTVLDGEWTTSSSTFVAGSGDGTAGGTFNFRFNVLVGDTNASGGVNGSDRTATVAQLFQAMTTSNFRANVDGSGSITGADVTPVVSNLFRSLGALPAIPAAVPPAVTAATFAALGSTSVKLGGTVVENGGSAVLERGVIYVAGDTGSPQIGDPGVIQVLAAGLVGIFDVDVAGLSPSTSYRFRAFVTTAVGTAYTPAFTFTTLA